LIARQIPQMPQIEVDRQRFSDDRQVETIARPSAAKNFLSPVDGALNCRYPLALRLCPSNPDVPKI
jgi:hypothetical protein